MADKFSKEQRSRIMARIAGKDTKPEVMVRKWLFAQGFRYRKNDNRLPGKPDMVFPKYRAVVFVHGCFWHGHEECRKAKLPETAKEFWTEKISRNRERDRIAREKVEAAGWRVFVIWQCEISNRSNQTERLERLALELKTMG